METNQQEPKDATDGGGGRGGIHKTDCEDLMFRGHHG